MTTSSEYVCLYIGRMISDGDADALRDDNDPEVAIDWPLFTGRAPESCIDQMIAEFRDQLVDEESSVVNVIVEPNNSDPMTGKLRATFENGEEALATYQIDEVSVGDKPD